MKTPSSWSSSWPSLLARCRILDTALTGQISGCLLSVFSVIDCPFSLFFWIWKVTLTFFSTIKLFAVFFSLIIALFLSWMIKSRGVNAFMTHFPEGYSSRQFHSLLSVRTPRLECLIIGWLSGSQSWQLQTSLAKLRHAHDWEGIQISCWWWNCAVSQYLLLVLLH